MLKVFILGTLLSQYALADYSAQIYEMGSAKQKKIYNFQVTQAEKEGLTEQTSTFKDEGGQEMVVEKAILKGAEFVRMELDHKQIGQKATVEIKDGRIYFTKTLDGKTKKDDEKLGKNFVISSNLQRFVKENWADLSSGKKVSFRYGSWERLETVGFELKKTGEEKIGEEPAVVLKMEPSSFIIAALVKPLTFKFSADGSRLLEMKGRVAPKLKAGNDWKDLDAEISYTY